MDVRYQTWIAAYVERQQGFVRGKCAAAAAEMQHAFPELRLAAGFAHTPEGAEQHHWCVAPDGTVVDPTAKQFLVVFSYEALDLTNPADLARVPVGVCMSCGGDVFGEVSYFCSDRCMREAMRDMGMREVSPRVWRSS